MNVNSFKFVSIRIPIFNPPRSYLDSLLRPLWPPVHWRAWRQARAGSLPRPASTALPSPNKGRRVPGVQAAVVSHSWSSLRWPLKSEKALPSCYRAVLFTKPQVCQAILVKIWPTPALWGWARGGETLPTALSYVECRTECSREFYTVKYSKHLSSKTDVKEVSN